MSRWTTVGEAFAYEKGYTEGRADASQQQWIPCTPESMPEAERSVLVTVEVRPIGFMPYKRVVKAFYEDGKVSEDESAYSWCDFENYEENENGEFIIPEGWWEDVDYEEEFTAIGDFVIAWMPLPKPWEGGRDEL